MTRRERYVLIICGVAAAVILAVRFLALPQWRSFVSSLSEWNQLEEQRAQYARLLADSEAVEKRMGRAQTALAGLENRFFAAKDRPQAAVLLLEHAEELAAAAGVAVQSKDILGIDERRGLQWVKVSLNVECSPAQLTKFLYSAGHDDRHLTLDALEVQRNEGTTVLRCRLDISCALPQAAGGERE